MLIEKIIVYDELRKEVLSTNSCSSINFGRDPSKCSIKFPVNSPGVSRVHATLKWNESSVTVEDSSTYGTLINGKTILKNSLAVNGNFKITIGGKTFYVNLIEKEPLHNEPDKNFESIPASLTCGSNKRKNDERENECDIRRGPLPKSCRISLLDDDDDDFFGEPMPKISRKDPEIESPSNSKTAEASQSNDIFADDYVQESMECSFKENDEVEFSKSHPVGSTIESEDSKMYNTLNNTKFTDLIFNDKKPKVTMNMSANNGINFKRFKKKGSSHNGCFMNSSTISNTTIPLIDFREITISTSNEN